MFLSTKLLEVTQYRSHHTWPMPSWKSISTCPSLPSLTSSSCRRSSTRMSWSYESASSTDLEAIMSFNLPITSGYQPTGSASTWRAYGWVLSSHHWQATDYGVSNKFSRIRTWICPHNRSCWHSSDVMRSPLWLWRLSTPAPKSSANQLKLVQ